MSSLPPRLIPAAVAALVAVAVLVGCTTYDPRGTDEGPPSGATSGASIAAATPAPRPSAEAGGAIHVVLSNVTADAVTIDVTDRSATLVGAISGTPGDGATVDAYKLTVANVSETRLRLTWVGGPCDSANTLSIDGARHQFLLVQPECAGDAIATDRILELTFSSPIRATDVQGSLQDGLDTSN